jgi:hypothetical protein
MICHDLVFRERLPRHRRGGAALDESPSLPSPLLRFAKQIDGDDPCPLGTFNVPAKQNHAKLKIRAQRFDKFLLIFDFITL